MRSPPNRLPLPRLRAAIAEGLGAVEQLFPVAEPDEDEALLAGPRRDGPALDEPALDGPALDGPAWGETIATAVPVDEPLSAAHTRSLTPRLRELAEMLGEAAVIEIVQTFAEDTQANLAVMRQAAGRNDSSTIYRSAHSIAGAARNVGADALATRASMLEREIGTFSAVRVAAEIVAMQLDLDAALNQLGINPEPFRAASGDAVRPQAFPLA